MRIARTRGWQASFADAQERNSKLFAMVLLRFGLLAGLAVALRFFELST